MEVEVGVAVLHPQVPHPPAPQAQAHPVRALANPAAVAVPAAPVARGTQAQPGNWPENPRMLKQN